MQNRRWLVAFLDWQQMRKSAFDLRVEPELDDPDGSLLLGNSLRLDKRLCDPYPAWLIDAINQLCLIGYIGLLLRITGDARVVDSTTNGSRGWFKRLTRSNIKSAAAPLIILVCVFFLLGGRGLFGFFDDSSYGGARLAERTAPSLAYYMSYVVICLWAGSMAARWNSLYVRYLTSGLILALLILLVAPLG